MQPGKAEREQRRAERFAAETAAEAAAAPPDEGGPGPMTVESWADEALQEDAARHELQLDLKPEYMRSKSDSAPRRPDKDDKGKDPDHLL